MNWGGMGRDRFMLRITLVASAGVGPAGMASSEAPVSSIVREAAWLG
jgi:hypothetical protein